MRPNPYIVQTLKYATLTLAGCAVIAIGAAVLRNPVFLTGRLVTPQERGTVPTAHIPAQRFAEGGAPIPLDTHVIIDIPLNLNTLIETFFGGNDVVSKVRFWVYCYSGNEARNKAEGLTGMRMYDGRFYYSNAELAAMNRTTRPADSDLLALRSAAQTAPKDREPGSQMAHFTGGQTCYVMVDGETATAAGWSGGLPAGPDSDGDTLNDYFEKTVLNTNPRSPDTDRDGMTDDVEYFKAKTDPRLVDTDRDGLGDGCEDTNANGELDADETSPIVADTDRDGLCDGDGFGPGCPEPRKTFCALNVQGDRECVSRPSTPVHGEDMNRNCQVDDGETDPRNPETFGKPDWDFKWEQLSIQTGIPQSDAAKGTVAPEFPIPGLLQNE